MSLYISRFTHHWHHFVRVIGNKAVQLPELDDRRGPHHRPWLRPDPPRHLSSRRARRKPGRARQRKRVDFRHLVLQQPEAEPGNPSLRSVSLGRPDHSAHRGPALEPERPKWTQLRRRVREIDGQDEQRRCQD